MENGREKGEFLIKFKFKLKKIATIELSYFSLSPPSEFQTYPQNLRLIVQAISIVN